MPAGIDLPNRDGVEITLGHLSDHTSSLPRMPDNFSPADPNNPYADYTADDMYDFLATVELTREIGSEYEYSNLAQGLLGYILARKAGMSYSELLQNRITGPLKMKETKVVFDKRMMKNLAVGHDAGGEVSNWDLGVLAGAGGIRSSVHDMLMFLQANMDLTPSPLSDAMKLSHQERHQMAGNDGVGLGWHIIHSSEGDFISHGGATGGYRAFTAFNKKTKTGVVVMTNSTTGADDIARYIMAGSPLTTPKRDAAIMVRKAIDEDGVEAGVATYKRLKSKNALEYEFNENSMNGLGYYYLQRDNIDAALAIFKLNIKEHPKSSNVYDSYAEGLMKQSIAYYKKSIELNPNNQNGIDMLAKMGVDIEAKEVKLTQVILEGYVGNYQLAPTFFIEITHDDGHLYAQATGQDRFELFPTTETEFYLKVVDAQVTFSTNETGQAERLILYQNGQEMPGTRVE